MTRVLMCTQIVDRTDSALGVIHKWIHSMSSEFEKMNVVCLKEGDRDLPNNVKIHSLGKETAQGSRFGKRVRYISRFYKYIWKLRNEYDVVLVHMNQEYILLGGLFWLLTGKKIFMWRNHYAGTFITDIAASFCEKVFCTSRFSYTAKYKKTVLMPVGVDVSSCKLEETIERVPNTILFLGRMSEAKRPHLLMESLGILEKEGVNFSATFAGPPKKEEYVQQLKDRAEELNISTKVKFVGGVPNTKTYCYYRASEIYVNCSRSGMFDKSIFKSVACGCLTLAASLDFKDLVGGEFIYEDNNAEDLALKLKSFLKASDEERSRLKGLLSMCIDGHKLERLVVRLREEMSG